MNIECMPIKELVFQQKMESVKKEGEKKEKELRT